MERVAAVAPSSLAPEHDWRAASQVIRPALRPPGTRGTDGLERRVPSGTAGEALLSNGPAGLPVGYVIPCSGFDVLVGMEHLLSWGVDPADVHAAAIANLAAWSEAAPWAEEIDGPRRIVWSDAGGMDAARILLPEVRSRLADDLGPDRRVLIGVPERDLLIATALDPADAEFESLFAEYVADRAREADDPVDGRLFELVDGELAEPAAAASA